MDKLLTVRNNALWQPHPENLKQQAAVLCPADELFFGGAAGGGKSDCGLGLAVEHHERSLILRREAVHLQGLITRSRQIIGQRGSWNGQDKRWILHYKGIEKLIRLGGCKELDDRENYQGNPFDLYVFDEITQFLKDQYLYIIGWNRHETVEQRCRVLVTGNPPTSPEGLWVLERWGAWLDPKHPKYPTPEGVLRWYTTINGEDTEVDYELLGLPVGSKIIIPGEKEPVQPKSRTFIRSTVDDNPYYRDSGYKSTLQAMPEPLRSQMLNGDFTAGMEDDEWQVIPTMWVQLAMARGKEAQRPKLLDAVGVDPARGGEDETVLSFRYGLFFDNLLVKPGKQTPDGQSVASLVQREVSTRRAIGQADDPIINIDVIGIGASVFDCLNERRFPGIYPVNFAEGGDSVEARDRSGKLKLSNIRALLYWKLREALDPEHGEALCLPDDPKLLADLCAPRYSVKPNGIVIEKKSDIKKRIGRSPDRADAVVLAWYMGNRHFNPQSLMSASELKPNDPFEEDD